MKTQTLDGHPMPAIGLGTWELQGEECERAVGSALDLGYRHIDTAFFYGNESEIGRALAGSEVDRGDVFLTTKVWSDHLAPEAVRRTTEESLRALQTSWVDLLLIHWPNPAFPLGPTLAEMQNLRDEGKVRSLGVSNFPAPLVEQSLGYADLGAVQVEYHPYLAQTRLLELCRQHELLLTAYCPIAKNRVAQDSKLQAIARRYGKTPAQVTLRWHLQQDGVCAIPKAASPAHQRENLDLFDFELDAAEMATIHGLAHDGGRIVDPAFGPDWDS